MPQTIQGSNGEQEALDWLESVTGEAFDRSRSFQEVLKDGVILCKAFNNVFPQIKVLHSPSTMPFKQMENIASFLHGLSKVNGFRSFDLFTTVDLFEAKNMEQVKRCILACKRLAEKNGAGVLSSSAKSPKVVERNESSLFETRQKPQVQKNYEDIFKDSVEEASSNRESNATEPPSPSHQENDALESVGEFKHETDDDFVQLGHEFIEPEVVLVESPKEPQDPELINEPEMVFSTTNPGTFEIEIS